MIRYVFLAVLGLTGPLWADTLPPALPALYDVAGVAADDHLNVRRLPDPGSDVIGRLDPDQTRVEVTALSLAGDWARINTGETAGWVALRFLAPHDGVLDATSLTCYGTEPFWSMNFSTDDTLLMSTPEREQSFPIDRPVAVDAIGEQGFVGLRFDWMIDGTPATSHILPGQCSDGMSDRMFGLHYVDTAGPYLGCCSLN